MLSTAAFLFSIIFSASFSNLCFAADADNLQDTCPTAKSTQQTVFLNGYPCKDPATIASSDFKSSKLNTAGDTDNFLGSSTAIITAAEFPGLNTLGLAVARTDLEIDGIVMPHSHPRASELFFVNKGVVIVGFVDTENQVFQKKLSAGDVFVFPRGLLHFCFNSGFETAVAFSVLNSQNPGLASITGAILAPDDSEAIDLMKSRLISLSASVTDSVENDTVLGFGVAV